MNELVVCETYIRQDDDGRYCLNDLHKASGGRAEHRPGHFLRNKQAKALIRELGGAQICASVIHGDGGGTYVAKELVYAYAMWISPAFHVKVIRTYDALMQAHIDKLNTLGARRARAELEFLEAQRDASRCGFGLRRWRDERPALEARIEALRLDSQPSLFLN
jgi:hypothetical protein